ncbi:DUF2179 domain-containing protein [Oceanobacillus longus]|uniref:DUF2179 domain-containing protein n=1 Tax=Oceanobacillus longus TaxID=930120 RepID=A0ABV8H400_9BACI
MLYVVINQRELLLARKMIIQTDQNAFITIHQVEEVISKGNTNLPA